MMPVNPAGAGTYDDTHTSWIYSGNFMVQAATSAYQGGFHYTSTMNDSAEFTFTGSQISLLYTGNTNRGKLDVFLDRIATINEYTATVVFQKQWTSGNLGAGDHTITFVRAGPSGSVVNIDAITVGDYVPPAAGVYDDVDSGWTYGSGFTTSAITDAYGGGIHYTSTVGSYAEFTFSGSQFALLYIGNTNRAQVDVFVDENPTKIATIDEYNATRVAQMTWSSGPLTPGGHLVKLVHASGAVMDIDAIQVISP